MRLIRAYIRRELPAWGRLYALAVGDYHRDQRWRDSVPEWVKGKSHGYDMLLNPAQWSNRFTYFVGRYHDAPNLILVRALLKHGGTFVDIGANEGMISLEAARQVGPAGRVISFEPNPGPANIFSAAIERNKLNQVDLRRTGLSDQAGVLKLYVPDINSGEGSFARKEGREVTCPVMVADEALSEVRPDFIKIDVEGFELKVLAGLKQTLARSKAPISLEMHPQMLAAAGTSPKDLEALLGSYGYKGFAMSERGQGKRLRLTLSEIRPSVGSYDGLFLHKDDPRTQTIRVDLARIAPY